MSTLNQIPDTMNGIKAVRAMDFVWGVNPFFDSTRQYCDVLLPCATFWEKPNKRSVEITLPRCGSTRSSILCTRRNAKAGSPRNWQRAWGSTLRWSTP